MRALTRAQLVLLAAVLGGGLGLFAPAAKADSLVGGVNQLRAAASQPQLPLDARIQQVLDYAAGDAPCPLSSCFNYGSPGQVDEAALYHALGGPGQLALAAVDSSVADSPAVVALAADPRATAMAQGIAADGTPVLGVALDSKRSFVSRLVTPVDLGYDSFAVLVLDDGSNAQPQIYENRNGSQVPVNAKATITNGALGAKLISYSAAADYTTAPRLAYGTHYRLTLGSSSVEFQTPTVPASFLNQSWQFAPTMSAGYRQLFTADFTSAPALYRQIAAELDGAVQVRPAGCGGNSSCAGFDGKHFYISMKPSHLTNPAFGRFAVLHEFGHIIEYLGLDEQGYAAFRQLFMRSPNWPQAQKALNSGVPFDEILADQFAFWGTNIKGTPSAYADPALAKAADFARVLKAQFAFRPSPLENPLFNYGP